MFKPSFLTNSTYFHRFVYFFLKSWSSTCSRHFCNMMQKGIKKSHVARHIPHDEKRTSKEHGFGFLQKLHSSFCLPVIKNRSSCEYGLGENHAFELGYENLWKITPISHLSYTYAKLLKFSEIGLGNGPLKLMTPNRTSLKSYNWKFSHSSILRFPHHFTVDHAIGL